MRHGDMTPSENWPPDPPRPLCRGCGLPTMPIRIINVSPDPSENDAGDANSRNGNTCNEKERPQFYRRLIHLESRFPPPVSGVNRQRAEQRMADLRECLATHGVDPYSLLAEVARDCGPHLTNTSFYCALGQALDDHPKAKEAVVLLVESWVAMDDPETRQA